MALTEHSKRWRETTQKEFFAVIGPLDVHPRVEGSWPYTAFFEDKARRVHGKTTGHPTRYFLPTKQAPK